MKKIRRPERAFLPYLSAITLSLFVGMVSTDAQSILNTRRADEVIANELPVTPTSTSTTIKKSQKHVVITGVRFAYPLVQKWIDDYTKENPEAQIVIESRWSTDPAKYDILIEAYDEDAELLKSREYVYIARYAVVPVANASSEFAQTYSAKGLTGGLINQLYFHNIYADKDKEKQIKEPYTIYTRLQKAGAPITFAKYFGHGHQDIIGKAIAGSDEHLLKAILRDSTSLSYLPLTLAFDHASKKPVDGLSILPVDLNGNGKVNDEEKFYDNLTQVIDQLEQKSARDVKNVPIEYLHISVDENGSPEAVEFLRWVLRNGQKSLHDFGYLNPEPGRFRPERFEQFASKRLK